MPNRAESCENAITPHQWSLRVEAMYAADSMQIPEIARDPSISNSASRRLNPVRKEDPWQKGSHKSRNLSPSVLAAMPKTPPQCTHPSRVLSIVELGLSFQDCCDLRDHKSTMYNLRSRNRDVGKDSVRQHSLLSLGLGYRGDKIIIRCEHWFPVGMKTTRRFRHDTSRRRSDIL